MSVSFYLLAYIIYICPVSCKGHEFELKFHERNEWIETLLALCLVSPLVYDRIVARVVVVQ